MFPPLLKGFYANSFLTAFLLNAISASLVSVTAVFFRDSLKQEHLRAGDYTRILLSTFLCAVMVYVVMFLLFRFGGGMIATPDTFHYPFLPPCVA